jgi:hypothetical protein
MTRRLILFAFVVLFPSVTFAKQATSPIDGVWKIAERTETGANASSNTSPQPSLLIFARGHYSWLSINGTVPRTQSPAPATGKMTDADRVARFQEWDPVSANAGTFEVKGSSLTTRPMVAKNVSVMSSNNPITREFKLDGDTLLLTQRSTGPQAGEVRLRLTRVR